MEVAVTGVLCGEDGDPMWTEGLVAREQALAALATNCARQMFVEDERGSIADGKYADFLLVDRTCGAARRTIFTLPSSLALRGSKRAREGREEERRL